MLDVALNIARKTASAADMLVHPPTVYCDPMHNTKSHIYILHHTSKSSCQRVCWVW